MNLHLDYKLRLISEKALAENAVNGDEDFDAIYEVSFHMDDLEITHELDPATYHSGIVSEVPTEDIAEIEDELRSWLEGRSADGSLLVKEDMTYDVAFKVTPKGIKFRHLQEANQEVQ
jgi:DNA-directed RNA polymerase subunit F